MCAVKEQLTCWAIDKIKTEFSEDVCLLLGHTTLMLDEDQNISSPSYYIPANSRANGLAQTFMIGGVGYDLFPMSWDRIEGMADVNEYNTTCLADAVILYARSGEDRQRFTSLQERLAANLRNPVLMRSRATKWVDAACEVFIELVFAESIGIARNCAGHIADYLSIAVAYANGMYLKHGQTNQLDELAKMKLVPVDFQTLYQDIIHAATREELQGLCHRMIGQTKMLLQTQERDPTPGIPYFADLAFWYQELSYTWRRVYSWCDKNNPTNAYMWACMLQRELDLVAGQYRLADTDFLSAFQPNDLPAFRKRAAEVEHQVVLAIEKNGVQLNAYHTVEEFLQDN